ncbi:serine hydrolase domain-containing protein [Flagellimonas myxillae]|uniref:serine hydrolase domain-containing protein n=1 Tax=Flagellimonas myxillae TaxID=2942214 RepID=UPI00201F803D|nr:serine hydrolase domain-containing protein [Muricauda myxillae]MCL6265972.1 beta-lactamase family protein [Muricauda myxillae]
MKSLFTKTVFLLFLAQLLWQCSKEDDLPKIIDQDSLNALIEKERKRENAPAIAAVIVKDGQVVWENFAGFKTLSTSESPDENTAFILASVSKTVVAVAVMQLMEQGLLELEEDVNTYIPFALRNPNFPNTPITTRMLLTHTSSLSWPTNQEDPNFNKTFESANAPDIYPWLRDYLTPNNPNFQPNSWQNNAPGTSYQYSNLGAAVLGYLVQTISRKDFHSYCKEHIFTPLQMHNTAFKIADLSPTTDFASLYFEDELIPQYSASHYPAFALRSTTADMANFMITMLNGGVLGNTRVLEEATVQQMLAIKVPDKKVGFLWTELSGKWIGHIGEYWGVSSSMDIHREKNLGVFIVSNNSHIESIYPEGQIYRYIHKYAEQLAD